MAISPLPYDDVVERHEPGEPRIARQLIAEMSKIQKTTLKDYGHGDYIAKFSLAPASANIQGLAGTTLNVNGEPNGLREALIDFFRDHAAAWDFRVQLRTNAETMPVEDASVVWPEEESPHVAVARLEVAAQPAWSEARARRVDDGLAFSPWTGLAAHRPLGAINRARQAAYATASRFRAEKNACPIHEPRVAPSLPQSRPRLYGTTPGREGRRAGTPDELRAK